MAREEVSFLDERLDMLSVGVGQTPVIRLADDELDLYAKLEFSNPNGSSKDRSAFWILKRAIERGDITPGTTVIESSSGNFAMSMASFCTSLGLDFVPVIDPNCNASTERFLRTLCRRVEKIDSPDATGFLAARLARIQELRQELGAVYWPNQYTNADGAAAHYRLTGGELVRTFRSIDYLFVGVSTGGTIAGLSRRMKEVFPDITVVAVDAVGSVIFGGPPSPRRIPGLGSGIVPPLVGRATIDDVVMVPERDAAVGCTELLTRHGIFAGGSTGSVYAAIRAYFAPQGPGGRRPPDRRPTVVFLCADRGTGYAATVYDPAWVAENLADEFVALR